MVIRDKRPPKSNYQRQVEFRKRHPGYFRKYNARQKASRRAAKAKVKALIMAAAAQVATPEPLAIPVPPMRLMLPAPVVDSTIAAINALARKRIHESIAA